MKLSLASIAALAVSAAAAPVLQLRATGFDFNADKVRGVNLGGWLVLEPWITPSLWKQWASNPSSGPVDEFNLCKTLGKSGAQKLLKPHWDSWFSYADFQAMKAAGLNTVRIPIGYWAYVDDAVFVGGQDKYLEKAIGWARSVGLKVWIDVHGAPGSQNGFDNSGQRDSINWQSGDNVKTTLSVLNKIAKKYAAKQYQDVVVVIELLNEPLGVNLDMDQLKQFYLDGFGTVRDVSKTFIAYSDAFKEPSYWNGVLSDSGNNALIDHHHYQVFSPDQTARSPTEQVSAACGSYSEIDGSDKYVVTGEWSGAMTDCARWLNGWDRGNRFENSYQGDGTYHGSCEKKGELGKMSGQEKDELRRYIEAQLDTYEKKSGWIFWTWKAEGGNNNDDWNMSKLLNWGIFPKPVTARKFPNQC